MTSLAQLLPRRLSDLPVRAGVEIEPGALDVPLDNVEQLGQQKKKGLPIVAALEVTIKGMEIP